MSRLGVLVSGGCHNKCHKLGGSNTQKCILSQLQQLEVQKHSVSKVMLLWKVLPRTSQRRVLPRCFSVFDCITPITTSISKQHSLCISLVTSPSLSLYGHWSLDQGPTRLQYDLLLTNYSFNDLLLNQVTFAVVGDINQPITWVLIGLFRHLSSVFMREQLRQRSSRGRVQVLGRALADPEGKPWKQGQLFSHCMDCPVYRVYTHPGPASLLSQFMYISHFIFITPYMTLFTPFYL